MLTNYLILNFPAEFVSSQVVPLILDQSANRSLKRLETLAPAAIASGSVFRMGPKCVSRLIVLHPGAKGLQTAATVTSG